MNKNMDQIILSTNEDPTYMDFWPIVGWAYSKMFPDVTIHLAFLTNRVEDNELVTEFRRYGKVTLFRPVDGYPEFGQAKMIRFLLASQQESDVCYIDDIDLFPLSKEFITSKVGCPTFRPPSLRGGRGLSQYWLLSGIPDDSRGVSMETVYQS